MAGFPSGTVTFLFTDIQGSTKLAREHPGTWDATQARHHAILHNAIERHQGYIFQIIGDAFCAAFHTAGDALHAAVKSQVDLHKEEWGSTPIKVRMGIHTGKAEIRENGEYQGYLAMSRVQRLMSAGHGGQVLISAASQELLLEDLPETVSLRDLGERRLKDLIRPEHIYQLVIPGLPIDFPPLKTLDLYRHNLPVELTSFIGRQNEMEEIKQSILSHRLVTLTGAGGTGKTRLALQLGADLLDQFPDGIWFVYLAPINDPNLIPQTILSAMGIPEKPGLTEEQQLLEYLNNKKLLLLLDNCEHVIEASEKLVEILLNHTVDLRILATSRETLGILGEVIWQVPSLSLPDVKQLLDVERLSQYEAVQLFIERATLTQPHFHVTNANAPAIAQICFRLDGIPLAIELAAARVRTLGVDQIYKRLDDRFHLLTGGNRMTLERHQTLRATIDWSYNLLSEDEKILFRRLTIFAGGWTLEAAEQVCGGHTDISSNDVLDLITHLVDKSLVILNESRYHMLETTRQYAHERLLVSGENDVLRDRHLKYFLYLAEAAAPKLHGEDQEQWLSQLEMEHNNLRAALEWSLVEEKASEAGLRLSSALITFWLTHGYLREGQTWLEQLLALGGAAPAIVRAKALTGAGTMAWGKSDYNRAVMFHQDSLALYRTLEDQRGIAEALTNLGAQALAQGKFEQALPQLQESLNLYRILGDRAGTADALMNLGEVSRYMGDPEAAAACYSESLTLYRELGDLRWIAGALHNLGLTAIDQGNIEEAFLYHQESLLLFQRLGEKQYLPESLEALADMFSGRQQPEPAARLLGAAAAFRNVLQIPLRPVESSAYEHVLAAVHSRLNELGNGAFDDAWKAGERMAAEGWEQVLAYVLTQSSGEKE